VQRFAPLTGKRIGLITNQTGWIVAAEARLICLCMRRSELVALFSPEHGIRGAMTSAFRSSTDEATRPAGLQPLWG